MGDVYTANGDGTFAHQEPCARCGSSGPWLLHEGRSPECLPCFQRFEPEDVRRERRIRLMLESEAS